MLAGAGKDEYRSGWIPESYAAAVISCSDFRSNSVRYAFVDFGHAIALFG